MRRGRRANHQIAAMVPSVPKRASGFLAFRRPMGAKIMEDRVAALPRPRSRGAASSCPSAGNRWWT